MGTSVSTTTMTTTTSTAPTTTTTMTTTIEGQCINGWSKFGNSCYKYFNEKKNWNDAERTCNEFGAQLTSIHSQDEADFIAGLLADLQEMDSSVLLWTWIGGLRSGNVFQWIDGSTFDFTYWRVNEPNNAGGNENCIHSWTDNMWNDLPCYRQLIFLYKKQLREETTEAPTTSTTLTSTPEFSVITHRGWCKHVDGGFPSRCDYSSYNISTIDTCESYCKNQPSCVGYMYHPNYKYCAFFPTDSTCPRGFNFAQKPHTAKTVKDLIAEPKPGYLCYGRNQDSNATTDVTTAQPTTRPAPEFERVNWSFGYMNVRYVGGKSYRIWRRNLSEYIKLASNDERIVAFGMHPDQIMAAFFTHIEGSASPMGLSWPLYVRRTLNNESWTAGSYVSLGDPNLYIPSPYPN